MNTTLPVLGQFFYQKLRVFQLHFLIKTLSKLFLKKNSEHIFLVLFVRLISSPLIADSKFINTYSILIDFVLNKLI